MAVTVVRMAPGWKAKVGAAAVPFRNAIMDAVVADIRQNIVTGGHVQTGALLASVRKTYGKIVIGTDHWAIIEYGSRPHLIVASAEHKVLANRTRVFGKVVHHPGTSAYRVVRRAVYKKRNIVTGI